MQRILFGLCGILLLTTSIFAQSQATTGNIDGRAIDPNGAVVAGASVTATSQDNGFTKTATTDEDGNFIFVLLPPGKYRVEATGQGFSKATYENVIVTVGSKTALEINFSVGGQEVVVNVQDTGATIESTRTSISSTVTASRCGGATCGA